MTGISIHRLKTYFRVVIYTIKRLLRKDNPGEPPMDKRAGIPIGPRHPAPLVAYAYAEADDE